MPGTAIGIVATSRTNDFSLRMPRVFSSRYATEKMNTVPNTAVSSAMRRLLKNVSITPASIRP